MEKYKYFCDGGALCIGNDTFICHYMNNYGDGTHFIHIKNKGEDFPKNPYNINIYDIYHFEGSVNGTFNVYNYDCLSKEELKDPKNIIKTLSGRWGVYSVKHSGDMLLEKWD